MKKTDIARLSKIEDRIRRIAEDNGLLTTDILFEVVPARKMLESMAYMFPTNFSHWSFGRDYEKYRTIYEYTGSGIPYEQVWNFDKPRALIVETNPVALNIMVIAHVFGHVDFFLANGFLRRGREVADIAEEARNAANRFAAYEERFGKQDVERVMDAAMSIMWHENPDPFFDEPEEEELRERLIEIERAKLERTRSLKSEFSKPESREETAAIEEKLAELMKKTPPEPTHDLLLYISRRSPKPLKPWMADVISVIRRQARALSPNRRTKMLNEGWATYWHVKIMRQLFQEGLLTAEEHGVFNEFHSAVTRQNRMSLNWYGVGLALLNEIEDRWNKGRFGGDYEKCNDAYKLADWDTGAMLGKKKLFEIRSAYSDRMAVEEFFTDEFIRDQELYLYTESVNPQDGSVEYVVDEDDPEIIRRRLKSLFTLYGTPLITVEDGDCDGAKELYLKHRFSGYELDPHYRNGTLRKIYDLWGKPVHLEAAHDGKLKLFTFDGKGFSESIML